MTKRKGDKVTITERAAVQRINRKLAHEGRFVRGTRGRSLGFEWNQEYWRFGVIDASTNVVMDVFDLPGEYGRELGVIKAWETVKEGVS
jgi:hypothetical protein